MSVFISFTHFLTYFFISFLAFLAAFFTAFLLALTVFLPAFLACVLASFPTFLTLLALLTAFTPFLDLKMALASCFSEGSSVLMAQATSTTSYHFIFFLLIRSLMKLVIVTEASSLSEKGELPMTFIITSATPTATSETLPQFIIRSSASAFSIAA